MYTIIEEHGKVPYGVKVFLCDTIEDLQILPPCEVGSKAEIIDSGLVYILNNQKEWVLTTTPSGVSDEILQVIASNSQAIVNLKSSKVNKIDFSQHIAEYNVNFQTLNNEIFGNPGASTPEYRDGLRTSIKNLTNSVATLSEQVNNLDVSLTALRLITDTMLEKNVLVDIRYFAREFDDDYNRLFLDRDWNNIKFTDKTTMYDIYNFRGEALDLSSIGGSAKYITSQDNTIVPVTLGTQFSIELYGVFNAGEILADGNYNIEISGDGKKFGSWYAPQGGNPYLETIKEYDLSKAHHIVLVGDTNKYKIYVDGAFDNEVDLLIQSNQDLLGNDNDIYIGGNDNASSHLIRFRVFDTALTDRQISSLYTSYWPL